jgi:hypothetical protein
MSANAAHKDQLIAEIGKLIDQYTALLAAVDDNKVNSVPYTGSWTAPQLLIHVSKSINGMARAMQTEAPPAQRGPGERIEELAGIFLDLTRKFNAPAFIIPEDGPYEKQAVIEKLQRSFDRFKESADTASLDGLVDGLPFGAVTKLEIIYFVLFHTQRHLDQMKRICAALQTE